MAREGMKAGYASPGLRWGLLLEDHPAAAWEATYGTAGEHGVPKAYGGETPVCVVTITFGPGSERAPVTAWKSVGAKGNAEDWNVLTTKTLGRALKRAGYPDDMPSLKALVLWRQRNAEVTAVYTTGALDGAAPSAPALAPGLDRDSELDDAAVATPDAISADDDDDGHATDEVVDEGQPPSAETLAALNAALARCGPRAGEVRAWARERGWRVTAPPTEDAAAEVAEYADRLADEVEHDAAQVATP